MTTRFDLVPWIIDGLKEHGGSVYYLEIAKFIWRKHKDELEKSGDFFYKWQYEMRWAGEKLVREKRIRKLGSTGVWELV